MTAQPSPYSAAPPRTRCARCGLIEVCGEREDEPVCSRCVWEMLDEARRERDAFRDSALAAESILRQHADALAHILGRDEGLPLGLHLPTVRMIVSGLEETQRQHDDLRDAARAVVEAFASHFCTPVRQCCHRDCRAVAMWWTYNAMFFCDDHRPTSTTSTEGSHAPAWRRLVAMVKP